MTINKLSLWQADLPIPNAEDHKYSRGQAVILASNDMVGATVLAATACARIGAGIVRVIVADEDSKRLYQSILPPHIVITTDFDNVYFKHTKAILAGPGLSQGDDMVKHLLSYKPDDKVIIFDGGALTYIGKNNLYETLDGTIVTPHAGEYVKLFDDRDAGQVATQYNCIIVKKGEQTLITNGDHHIENIHASPWLATAGTGDILAGMITGLMAQGMDNMKACAAAVWIHGEAGRQIGPGLVASDIAPLIPSIYRKLIE